MAIRNRSIFLDGLHIAARNRVRGRKVEIEANQQIAIELIRPISAKQQLFETWVELVSWSRPVLTGLGGAAKWVAIGLGVVLAATLAVMVLVALIQAIVSLLATLLLGAIIVAGLAAGAGADPIILAALEDGEDGTSTVYRLLSYSYPVSRRSS